MHDGSEKALVGITLALLLGCDPITSVQGRVVRSPSANENEKPGVANATVNVRCEGLKPDEGMTSTTDANGAFTMTTVGGALPDSCTMRVTPPGATAPAVTTTIGAAKGQGDDPKNRVRQVEIAVPEK